MDRDRIIIEADELLAKMDNSNLRIYDATIMFFRQQGETTAYEQYQQGHIPGAAFFDHQDFSDSDSKYMFMVSSEAALAESIGKIGISKDSEVVLYAINVLPAATRAWWLLRYAGHDNVRILNGGLAAWQAAGGQVETGINQYAPTTFETKLRPHMFANKEDVQAAMDDPAINVEYTLELAAYKGNYIPGSSLKSAMGLMQEMQSLKPNDDLTSQITLNPQYERTITYCGGGIAATVNAIAHLIAGNEQVAVYDGSLTEWMGEGLPTANASDDEER
jgi:thiosulfate/3-mercaptopyruvate sulfurtransferase